MERPFTCGAARIWVALLPLLAPSPALAATPTLVQHVATGMTAQPVTAFRVTLPNPAGSGNALILGMQFRSSGAITSVTDKMGNTWTAGPSVTNNSVGATMSLYYALNVAGGTQEITVTFSGLSGAPAHAQGVISEFYNVAPGAAYDGSSGSALSSTIDSFATSADGDLIYHWSAALSDATDNGGTYNGTGIAAGSGFTLLSADLQVGSADQYSVQSLAGPIDPTISTSGNSTWGSLALALKSAEAGTPPGPGNRVIHEQYTLFSAPHGQNRTANTKMQFPSSGNLLVGLLSTVSEQITGMTDDAGNTWASAVAYTNAIGVHTAQIVYAANAATSPNLSGISVTLSTQCSYSCSLILYDVTGAANSPLDVTNAAEGLSPDVDLTMLSLTPTTSHGLVFTAGSWLWDAASGVHSPNASPIVPNAIENHNLGGTPSSALNEDDLYAVYPNPDTHPVSFTRSQTTTSSDGVLSYWVSVGAAFKSEAPSWPSSGTSSLNVSHHSGNAAGAVAATTAQYGPPQFVSEANFAVEGGGGASVNQATLAIDVDSPQSLLIVAFHAEYDGGVPDSWSVQANGVPGTLLVETNGYRGGDGNRRFRIYYWLNPPVGTNSVFVYLPYTGPNELAVSAIVLSSVLQSAPFGDVALDVSTVARTEESESVVASTPNDLVVHVIADELYVRGTLGPDETSRSIANDGKHVADGDASLWVSTKPGQSPGTTVSSSGWASYVINGVAIVVHGTYDQTLTGITVTPATASVAMGGTQTFTATALDQFGVALATPPVFTWAVSGGGAISSTGLFTAGSTVGGPFTVTASSGGLTGSASVTVVAAAPITIGQTSVLSGQGSGDANSLQGIKASLGQAATVQSLSIYFRAVSGRSRLSIYTDSNNYPGTLKAQTAEFTPSVGWNTQAVTQPVSLSAGSYWLIWQTDNNSIGVAYRSGTTTGIYTQYAYGAPPSTFPSGGSSSPDESIYATLLTGAGSAAPTVATPGSAIPNPVVGLTTSLSVLGADDGGEANLTYTWTTTGTPPAPVTFSANGTNGAKTVTATFAKAGSYGLQVTIRDQDSLTVTSSVTVTVSATLTGITVTPATASVAMGGTQTFTATALDQFGVALATPPVFTWAVSGGGAISSTGLFTAGSTVGGPFTVTASSGGLTGPASVTVVAAAPITIGNTSVLNAKSGNDANVLLAYKVSLPQTAKIQSLSIYTKQKGGKLYLAIYSDNAGHPGALKASTAEFTPQDGWNTQDVTSQVSLPPGTYWLVYEPSSNTYSTGYDNSGPLNGSYEATQNYGPMPLIFPSGGRSRSHRFSLYGSLLP
jgi:hypothetical protein